MGTIWGWISNNVGLIVLILAYLELRGIYGRLGEISTDLYFIKKHTEELKPIPETLWNAQKELRDIKSGVVATSHKLNALHSIEGRTGSIMEDIFDLKRSLFDLKRGTNEKG